MNEGYYTESFIVAYFRFHYGRGFKELINVFNNFLWFISHFFSFKLLLSTIFSPWHRLGESYGNIFDLENFVTAFVVNSLMRVVGFVTRLIVLISGFLTYILALIIFLVSVVSWLIAPLILLSLLILSVTFFAL